MSDAQPANSFDSQTDKARRWARDNFTADELSALFTEETPRPELPDTLAEAAVQALNTANSKEKARLSLLIAKHWQENGFAEVGTAMPADEPAREAEPELVPPAKVPRRKINRSVAGRTALLHALCHIELHAINLCWDIIARFTAIPMPKGFYDDWVGIAEDEARHHLMLCERLEELGSRYGAMAAHDGLWQAADVTKADLKARLAIVPMVLEARGLDVTPGMIEKLQAAEDFNSSARLDIIYDEEITHVARGKRWFELLCEREGTEPIETWQKLVMKYFRGSVKSPFNIEGRDLANFPIDFYGPIADL
ncbi:ferritin-like domain-containing protein [Kiloniella sp. b19]|uniref:ferritin-like domain-containing protein n=1 Tax=Kiloniella sp. GXU_MW_B19 TaxID=3141326 RepID=UPI0031D4D252